MVMRWASRSPSPAKRIVLESLKLLESVKEPGTIIDSPFRWKRDRFEEMADGISLTEGEQEAIRN